MDRKHETAAGIKSPRRFFVDHFLLLQERLQLSQWPQQAEVPQLHLPEATARRIRISERFISEAPLRFFTSFRTTQTIRTVSR